MARKLLVMVALISLALLAQVASGLADMALPGSGGTDVNWVEYHQVPLGSPGNCFYAGYPEAYSFSSTGITTWGTVHLINQYEGTTTQQNGKTTLTINYDTIAEGTAMHIDGEPDISFGVFQNPPGDSQYFVVASSDFKITTTQTYDNDGTLIQETFFGFGHDLLNNGDYFTLTGTLEPLPYTTYPGTDYVYHRGIFTTDLQLTYGSADPSAVPIPGALWLLGTGLLGLACVGRRRKS
jgi:hypothetical protein